MIGKLLFLGAISAAAVSYIRWRAKKLPELATPPSSDTLPPAVGVTIDVTPPARALPNAERR